MLKILLVVALVAAGCLIAGAIFEKIAETRFARRYPPPGRLVDVGGRRMHLLCKGAAPGPTVVIEQGAASPAVVWEPIQDRLAASARVCLYDRAGYQWSDPAPAGRSLTDRAADLHRLLKAAGVPGPYVLVAHSYGGAISRVFAHRYPADVVGMVLVDTPEEAVVFRSSFTAYRRQFLRMVAVGKAAARVGLIRLVMGALSRPEGGMTPEMNDEMVGFISDPHFGAPLADELRSLEQGREDLAPVGHPGALGDLPLTVITHEKPFPGFAALLEPGWQDGQRRLAALSSRGHLVVAHRSTHMIQVEEPDLVIDAVRRVLGEASVPAERARATA
jgi:pimeloyl-ACP methyl ester carboxylesterase